MRATLFTKVVSWWNIANWLRAADLASKFVIVWAAFSASSLFLIQPKIARQMSVTRVGFDLDMVKQAYAAAGEIMPTDAGSLTTLAQQLEDLSYRAAVQGHVASYLNWPMDQYWLLLLEYFAPASPSQQLEGLDNEQIGFLVDTVAQAYYVESSLRLTNEGQTTAKRITISKPDAFIALDPVQQFELRPGDSRVFQFRYFAGSLQPASSLASDWGKYTGEDFQVFWDESASFSTSRFIIYLGATMVLIWISVVLRDVNSHDPK